MKPVSKDVFRAYDIRGIVDQDFDPQWVEQLGRACGTWFRRQGLGPAVVGHDCRHSSPAYSEALTRGLLAAGVDVTGLGMVPSPVFYYACRVLDRRAGVMITASHNPPEYNGFKVWAGTTTIHTGDIQSIYEIMTAQDFDEPAGPPPVAAFHDIVPAYVEDLAGRHPLQRPVRVVVDGGNGAGGEICAEVLRRAGADVVEQYCEPDGSFPNHHPDPVVATYMGDLMARVPAENAEFGVGLDGDADRIGAVDETGAMVYGDRLLAVYAREVLRAHPGAMVIAEGKCSHLMYRDIAAHGGDPLMWITGHSMIKAKMQETGALLAGEMSGHMFFADAYYGFDDAIYAALRLAELVAKRPGEAFSRYLDDWPVTHSTPELRMECPEEIKFPVVLRAQEYFRDRYEMVDVDGVRLTFPDGWALLRASNTQPVLVLRFEAETSERLAELRALVEEPMREWIEELSR